MASNQVGRILRASSSVLLRGSQRLCHLNKIIKLQQHHVTPFSLLQVSSAAFHNSAINCSRLKSSLINIQDEDDFKLRVVESTTPVVVDFHADWCGPCKLLGPRLETIVCAQNTEDQENVILAKVDIDQMPDIAMDYGVEAIPTVVGVKDGKVTNRFVGLKEDDEVETFVLKLIG